MSPVPSGLHAASNHRIPWTPTQVTPTSWNDTILSTITKDGSNQISSWADISGNNKHLTQATVLRQPIHDAANSWITLSATSRYFSVNAGSGPGLLPTGNQAWTIATVMRQSALPTTNPTLNMIYRQGNATDNQAVKLSFGRYGGPYNVVAFSWHGTEQGGSIVVSANTDYVIVFVYDPAIGCRSYINGSLDVNTAYVSANLPVSSSFYSIGPDPFETDFRGATGIIRTFLTRNGAITQSDREKLEGYLAWRWGIQNSLYVGHPYRNSIPYL